MKVMEGLGQEITDVRMVDFHQVGVDKVEICAKVLDVEVSRKISKEDEWRWRGGWKEEREQIAQEIAGKVFQDELTDKQFILKAVNAKMAECDKLEMDRYFSDMADMNILNPYFGYPAGPENKMRARGVFSVWARGTAARINAKIFPQGYAGDEKILSSDEMSVKQLRGIWHLMDFKCRQREVELNLAASNKDIEEYWPELEAWAKTCLESVQHKFAVQLQSGKRAYDRLEYKALVFYKNEGGPCDADSQIGHIPVSQDKKGFLWYKWCKPLCGETDSFKLDIQNPEAWKEQLKKGVEYMVGSRLDVREKTEQEKRISDICVYRHTCGGQMTAYYMMRCKIDGVQQAGRLVSDDSTHLHNVICNGNEGYLAKLKLGLAQKYFKDVLEATQQQDKGLRR